MLPWQQPGPEDAASAAKRLIRLCLCEVGSQLVRGREQEPPFTVCLRMLKGSFCIPEKEFEISTCVHHLGNALQTHARHTGQSRVYVSALRCSRKHYRLQLLTDW